MGHYRTLKGRGVFEALARPGSPHPHPFRPPPGVGYSPREGGVLLMCHDCSDVWGCPRDVEGCFRDVSGMFGDVSARRYGSWEASLGNPLPVWNLHFPPNFKSWDVCRPKSEVAGVHK